MSDILHGEMTMQPNMRIGCKTDWFPYADSRPFTPPFFQAALSCALAQLSTLD